MHIFTEIVNCGKIGKIAIDSYFKYHNEPIHVYGMESDFEYITENKLITKHIVSDFIVDGFNQGHLGTARLWASLINDKVDKHIVHFDSDVVFLNECLSDIDFENYDLIGAIRNYKNNPNNRNDVRHLPDIVQTLFFGFNTELISNYDFNTLVDMCRGVKNPLGHPVIDFFDPIEFDILKNGGKIKILDVDEYGGCTFNGDRNNKYSEINNFNTPFKINFGSKMIHFSAVGSGMAIHNNRNIDIPEGYKQYALDRYFLFCKVFYNENLINNCIYDNLIDLIKEKL